MAPARRAAKKAAAPPSPLHGSTIAIAGTFSVSQASVKQRIENLGAKVATTVQQDTDCLIATQADYDKQSTKVKAAIAKNVPIVSIDWLDECESSNSKVNTMKHLVLSANASAGQSQSNGAAKTGTKSKRAASPDPPATAPKKQKKEAHDPVAKVGDGQNAKSSTIVIPLDEYCPLSNYNVHVGDDGTIYDAALNQTNASANNNKFYKIQLLVHPSKADYKTWTRWGRVGEGGQNAMLGNGSLSDAISQFQKKFKAKSGLSWDARGENPKPGKYAYIEKSYNPDSDESEDDDPPAASQAGESTVTRAPVKCTLEKPVQALMELIFNQQLFTQTMAELNYDANKLPLGKLSKATISRGFQALKDLAALLQNPGLAQSEYGQHFATATEQLSNSYYSLIPHAFGRNRPPVIRSNDALKKEIELLESLGDMKDAAALMKNIKDDGGVHPLDRQFQGLGMDEMEPVDPNSSEFNELFEYLNNSKGSTHGHQYTIDDVFRIQRHGEFDRFEKSPYAKGASNRRLLWHGSRVTNFGGILGQGLRIAPPEAPATGYMFGKGIYLADMSSKSANYCCSYSSGGTALILLCEAELGTPMQELTNASYSAGEDAKAKGMYSTFGKGGTGPSKWKDAKCVHPSLEGVMMPDVSTPPGPTGVSSSLYYNEYICYDVAQVRLRYLLRIKM